MTAGRPTAEPVELDILELITKGAWNPPWNPTSPVATPTGGARSAPLTQET
jgi:hypothetical protein